MTRKYLFLAALAVGSSVGRAAAQEARAFPVPRAEKEFRALIPYVRSYAERVVQGDERSFVTAVAAYGPLDLQVTKAASGQEAANLKNYFYGIAGGASDMPPETIMRWGMAFPRPAEAVQERKRQVTEHLPQITALVAQMKKTPQITLLAQWGFKNEWRVNNAFYEQGKLREAIPTPVMGFVPSGKWKPYPIPQAYAQTLNIGQPAWDNLLKAFRATPIIALVRQKDGSVRAVRFGTSNNEIGLLFIGGPKTQPTVGTRLQSGQQYALLESVAPGVFYYEAN